MPKTKISEFSAIPGNNTDIDGINIAEGCPPSGINDAIRELMSQLKDFQAGTAGDSFNGPIGTTTPAAGVFTNLSASGTFALTGDQVQISEGGTGQTTANAAFNALAPSQSTHAGKYLKTDGTNTSWDALDISTADITGTLPIANGGTGLTALGTGVQTALGIAVGSSGAFVVNGGALGTPSSGTVTNLTGTASININGTVGATTPTTGAFTTLSASGNITVSGGTANGVAYLNGSKVLTTGSALTFDGTNLGLSNSAAATVVKIDGSGRYKQFETYSSGTRQFYIGWDNTSQVANITNDNNYPILFSITGSEQMRLTSTGLGIGTSTPAYKLDVDKGSAGLVARFKGGTRSAYIYSDNDAVYFTSDTSVATAFGVNETSDILTFFTNNTERARIDSSGNLGLGVTPSAWAAGAEALQMGLISSLFDSTNGYTELAWNAFESASGVYTRWYSPSSQPASMYRQTSGNHSWLTAGSGASGSTISWTTAMTLDASGNLGVGATSPAVKLDVRAAGVAALFTATNNNTNQIGFSNSGIAAPGFYMGSPSQGALQFSDHNGTERARITSGGYFKASNSGTYLGSTGNYHELRNTTTAFEILHATQTAASPYGIQINFTGAAPNGTGNWFLYCNDTGGLRTEIRSNGGLANYSANDVNLSDRREKTNFAPAKSYLDTICAIPVQTFNYIDQSEEDPGLTLGVVAQDVQAVAPELVMESNWGTAEEPKMRLSIYQTDLQYALMKCIQELKAQNDDLRARVAQLEAK